MARPISLDKWRKARPPYTSYFVKRRNPIAERDTFAPAADETGADFKYHQELSRLPRVLYWLRCSMTPVDALIHWASSGRSGRPLTRLRQIVTKELGHALGDAPFDFAKAAAVLKKWQVKAIRRHEAGKSGRAASEEDKAWYQLMMEVLKEVPVILGRHRDPRKFFAEVPRAFRSHFDTAGWQGIGHTMWIFGPGVLTNPDFRRAFDLLSPDEMVLALASAEGHTIRRAGKKQRPAANKPTPKRRPGRPLNSFKPAAHARPGTLEKQIYRRNRRRFTGPAN